MVSEYDVLSCLFIFNFANKKGVRTMLREKF